MNCPADEPLSWYGCYLGQYDMWTPASYEHPAKMSPGLAFRILNHLEELGLLLPGQTVLDPLCGVGTVLLAAAIKGHPAIGVELEPKFVSLAEANAARIARKGFGAPIRIIQGDARNLSTLLQERGLVDVSSPPYGNGANMEGGIDWEKAKRPDRLKESPNRHGVQGLQPGYGTTPGQIGALPDRPVCVTSPPYEEAFSDWRNKGSKMGDLAYGISPGNIGNLPAGVGDAPGAKSESWRRKAATQHAETYLEAMAQVYAEIDRVASVLVVVIKNPTREGKLRDLAGDTARIMVAAGWRIVDWHEAILFEEQEQGNMMGDTVKKPKGRLSFFKRLLYRKGVPVADHEDVILAEVAR